MDSHILKFIKKGKTFPSKSGICTNPTQIYGVSQDSPNHFKGMNTLQAKYGYKYQHQQAKQFQYLSQKHYFSVFGNTKLEENPNLNQHKIINPICFHRKKGRLSEFMDKNGWMSEVVSIMGDQRSPDARKYSNIDRQRRISLQKPKKKFHNSTARKIVDTNNCVSQRGKLMSEKCAIRCKRNSTADSQKPILPRKMHISRHENLHLQNINTSILKVTKQWMCKQYLQGQRFEKKEKQQLPETLDSWYQKSSCKNKWQYDTKINHNQF